MNQIEINISFPTDEGFLRRQCPLCRRDFKVLMEKSEIEDLSKKGMESFMLKQEPEEEIVEEIEQVEIEQYCPYCGQASAASEWWTDEQQAYIKVHIENIINQLLNKDLIRPLKRNFGRPTSGPFSIRFEGEELKQKEPWMSPETNDMDIFDLPCCKRKIKIREEWKEKVHCFFCGFPHKNEKQQI